MRADTYDVRLCNGSPRQRDFFAVSDTVFHPLESGSQGRTVARIAARCHMTSWFRKHDWITHGTYTRRRPKRLQAAASVHCSWNAHTHSPGARTMVTAAFTNNRTKHTTEPAESHNSIVYSRPRTTRRNAPAFMTCPAQTETHMSNREPWLAAAAAATCACETGRPRLTCPRNLDEHTDRLKPDAGIPKQLPVLFLQHLLRWLGFPLFFSQ